MPTAALRPLVPSELKIQEFDSTSWVGVVVFQMVAVARRPLPTISCLSTFLELNLRLYVECDGKPGVWFLSLDAASHLAVWYGKRYFYLPYHLARIGFVRRDDGLRFWSDRVSNDSSVRTEAHCRPLGSVFESEPRSLEAFLTERYCFYAKSPQGIIYRTEIHHAPWSLQQAQGVIDPGNLLTAHGLKIGAAEPLLHFSHGVDVVAWPPTRALE